MQAFLRDPIVIAEELRTATSHANNSSIAELLLELDASVMGYSAFPPEFFGRIEVLLGDDSFRRLENSWNLVYFLNSNWHLMTEEQRQAIKPVLALTFDKHANYMGAFITGEVLGRRYCDQDTLRTMTALSRRIGMPALALVPHALETLARNAKEDRDLFGQSVEALRELEHHPNEQVRKEASISLTKVNKGF